MTSPHPYSRAVVLPICNRNKTVQQSLLVTKQSALLVADCFSTSLPPPGPHVPENLIIFFSCQTVSAAHPSVVNLHTHSHHPVNGRCNPHAAYLNSTHSYTFNSHNLGKLSVIPLLSANTIPPVGRRSLILSAIRSPGSNGTLRAPLVHLNIT